ncbi:hypothetical protein [Jannaschia donghaensis]|uniref:Uncharacterized protein n=1 Tax=Jannaschia donghaensis TaxID=420998 RepID=A0A0M6YI66_9RHOB|nr:hypothetical protein [Jannaschia donghaensis]CTQ48967.1 hypothetical protein JDO7802_00975 [Jannaschia donghaensis]
MIRRLLAALPLVATLGALLWALQANPLAAPFVERSAGDLALTLEQQVHRAATADWIEAALTQAVAARDADRATMLIGLAQDLGRDVDTTAATAMIAAETDTLSVAVDCAVCMADTSACSSLSHLTFCAVPFEMTVLGDLNALRRAAFAFAVGQEVDEVDAGLALVGLGATGAVLVSGGSSVTVKAGATLLRLARRIGSITPELTRFIRVPIRWARVDDFVLGTARIEDVTDGAALARMGALAADLGRVRAATSTAEALRLARFVDTPADATRLARVAEAAGPRTTRTFAVLGKSRVFRATLRVSRAATGTLILIWLTAAQIAVILGTRIGSLAVRSVMRAI